MRVLISGWSGSSNLGDELVLAGLLRLLEGHQVAVVSVDPAVTQQRFGVAAVAAGLDGRLLRALRTADLVVFGGGGLLQDETSPFNLPYHLARPAVALAAGTPVVGVGLGAGPLTRPGSQTAVRLLSRAEALTVRDEPSRLLLEACGVSAQRGADLALALDPVQTAPEDVITVALRPWGSAGGWLPVGARRRHELPGVVLDTLAGQLDALADRSGLGVRLVALQADRDDGVHAALAARMRAPVERVAPGLDEVVEQVAAGRLVVAMRYHAGICAVLGGRPALLLGYSPKVEALGEELALGGRLLPWHGPQLRGLARAGADLLDDPGAAEAVAAARTLLRKGLAVDRRALDAGLAAARSIDRVR